jgi:CPA2 family monovalent cation:H+ antiporter-2
MAASINIPVYSDALVVLATAGIIVPFAQRWGLSPVLGYLVAGAILGPLGLGSLIDQLPVLRWFTVTDAKNVSGIADLGVVFLLFLIGLALSLERLMAMRRLVFGLGGLQIGLSTILISGALALIGQTAPIAMLLGACLAMSSTAMALEVLSKQGRLTTAAGRASFAVLLAQDLAVIPILVFITIAGSNSGTSPYSLMAKALIEAALALTIIVLFGRIFLRPLFRLVAGTRSSEVFIAASLFVIVATGVAGAMAGLSMALGAFVSGLLLAETEYRKAIEATIEPFKGLLLGLFFFTVGMNIDARELVKAPAALLASGVALIGLKALVLMGAGRLFKLPWPAAVETGLLLGPGGEFAFVGINLAAALGLMTAQTSSFALAVISLTMAATPLLAVAARRFAPLLERPAGLSPELAIQPASPKGHAIVAGYGRVGKIVCSLLKHHGIPYTTADHDAGLVTDERHKGHEVYYGDAANPAFLKACGVMDATGVIITIQTKSVTDDIVDEVRKLRPDILIVARARDAEHARHLYAMGVNVAVPVTIEASLQMSEAALLGFGVATGPVIASIHEMRHQIRNELQKSASSPGREGTCQVLSKGKATPPS